MTQDLPHNVKLSLHNLLIKRLIIHIHLVPSKCSVKTGSYKLVWSDVVKDWRHYAIIQCDSVVEQMLGGVVVVIV